MGDYMFKAELDQMQATKESIAKQAMAKMDPTVHTMARQCFDHLDASALFLQQLGGYIAKVQPTQAEEAVAKAAANGDIVGVSDGGKTE